MRRTSAVPSTVVSTSHRLRSLAYSACIALRLLGYCPLLFYKRHAAAADIHKENQNK